MTRKSGFMAGLFLALGAAAVLWAAHDDAIDYPYIPYDHTAIQYPTRAPDDAIARLQQKIHERRLNALIPGG